MTQARLLSILLLLAPAAHGAGADVLSGLPQLRAPVLVDGIIDGAAWQEAAALQSPTRTVMRAGRSGDVLYVAVRSPDAGTWQVEALLAAVATRFGVSADLVRESSVARRTATGHELEIGIPLAVLERSALETVATLAANGAQSRSARTQRWHGDSPRFEAGMDVTWVPSPAFAVAATINPDFSQIAPDRARLDLSSNFVLYFPERRPFFMDGGDYFATPFQVLYTRRIADPDFGLRITGSTDSGAYGALVARDTTTRLLLPGALGSTIAILDQTADVAAGRYRHDLGDHASVGVVATVRHGQDYHNGVVGFDGRWRYGHHTATAQVLRSQSRYPDALGLVDPEPEGDAWQFDYAYDLDDWSFNAWHTLVDPGFRADLGFIDQVGYEKSLLGGSRTWYGDEDARIAGVRLSADFDITHRHDGQLLEREGEAQLQLDGPMRSTFGVQVLARDRYWDGIVFDEAHVNAFGSYFPVANVQLGGNVRVGPQIDLFASRTGRGRYFDVWGELTIGIAHEVEFDLFRQSLQRDGGTAFAATVMDTRYAWQIDDRQHLRFSVQASRIDRDPMLYLDPVEASTRDLATQLVYSFQLDPRTSVYAGGTLGAFLDDENPELFASDRAAFVKLSYAWQP